MEPVSRAARISGWIIAGLIGLFMLVDGGLRVMKFPPYVKATIDAGYAASFAIPLGIVALVCAIAYLIPRTSVMGAILLTGYLGGAIATNIRVGQPLYFPLVFGILAWLALYLREPRLRALVPLRS
jgi:DoxX-like protein